MEYKKEFDKLGLTFYKTNSESVQFLKSMGDADYQEKVKSFISTLENVNDRKFLFSFFVPSQSEFGKWLTLYDHLRKIN